MYLFFVQCRLVHGIAPNLPYRENSISPSDSSIERYCKEIELDLKPNIDLFFISG